MVMRYTVTVSPRVVAKMAQQADYIAYRAGEAVASTYIGGLFNYFDGLDTFPERGHPRHDVLPGLWLIGYKDSVNIAVVVEQPHVYVVGVYFGGEDYEGVLHELALGR